MKFYYLWKKNFQSNLLDTIEGFKKWMLVATKIKYTFFSIKNLNYVALKEFKIFFFVYFKKVCGVLQRLVNFIVICDSE